MVANGGETADVGAKFLEFEFSGGGSGNMRFRLANVTNPRGAVSVCDGGNRVVFEIERSYPALKSCGKRIPIRSQNGMYVMDVRVGGSQAKPKKSFRRKAWRP